MSKISDISKDVFINHNGTLCVVTEFQRVSPGKGSSFVRTRLKNVATGKVLDFNFKDGDDVDVVTVERKPMQFLYVQNDECAFMDMTTFDQMTVPTAMLGGKDKFLKEGVEATMMMYDGAIVDIQIPKKVTLKVVHAPEAVRGDSSGNITKDVELETGATIRAPMFIKSGDEVIVNTETGEYTERA